MPHQGAIQVLGAAPEVERALLERLRGSGSAVHVGAMPTSGETRARVVLLATPLAEAAHALLAEAMSHDGFRATVVVDLCDAVRAATPAMRARGIELLSAQLFDRPLEGSWARLRDVEILRAGEPAPGTLFVGGARPAIDLALPVLQSLGEVRALAAGLPQARVLEVDGPSYLAGRTEKVSLAQLARNVSVRTDERLRSGLAERLRLRFYPVGLREELHAEVARRGPAGPFPFGYAFLDWLRFRWACLETDDVWSFSTGVASGYVSGYVSLRGGAVAASFTTSMA